MVILTCLLYKFKCITSRPHHFSSSYQLIQAAQNIQTALGCAVPSSGNGIGALSASPSLPSSSLNLTQSQQQQPQTTRFISIIVATSSLNLLIHIQTNILSISISPNHSSPQNQQLPPVANAGISQTVNENTKVTLDGRASYSPTGGIIVAYQWTQLPNGVPISTNRGNTATPSLTPSAVL